MTISVEIMLRGWADAVAFYGRWKPYRDEHAKWSDEAFGTPEVRGPIGPLEHCKKECDEAIANPKDIKEYADIFNLVLDAARRAGFSAEQLIDAASAKIQENKERKWQDLGLGWDYSNAVYYDGDYLSYYMVHAKRSKPDANMSARGCSAQEALDACKAAVGKWVSQQPIHHIKDSYDNQSPLPQLPVSQG